MSVIYFLITISIVVAIFFLYAFIRAVRSGQFDDDYTPSVRMLFEDELKKAGDALFEKLDHKDLNQLMQRPTAESICEYIMAELRFAEFDVIRVRVYEADDSFAEIKIVE